MLKLEKKEQCCGCTACANVCPKNCISMKADVEGFLYPVVDILNCIHCELCENSCPVLHKQKVHNMERKTYAVRSKSFDNLMHSTSGGIFEPFADFVLKKGGVICAASYDNEFNVSHIIIEHRNINLYDKIKGSKYVQSNMKDCLGQIEQLLCRKKLVGFVGTTCQVAGLKSFLKKDYPNLITIDLVCHGTPSPKLWRKYLDYQSIRYKSCIKTVSFRSKVYGYHSGGMMEIIFENGKVYRSSARTDYMLKSFFTEIASRPICYECPFKALERVSDLTVYDCWHFSQLVVEKKDDDKGYTNVIVQSSKGEQLLKNLKDSIICHHVDTELAINYDGIMIREIAKKHNRRDEFYIGLDKAPLAEHIQNMIPVSTKDYTVETVKQLLYKIGILQKVRRFMK